ncbi:hypothetical protein CPB84DRAFT_1748546 [Gymnopilus junonius]|uniref:Uncharacterized protein n=1 Tax=Gymnopilus junonius TaxID=109634 RepID=A0A9P5TME0_GYMJU|nr:hypothetical protein CPB84DRAFT_1748546 [Gymnopilus junonius]
MKGFSNFFTPSRSRRQGGYVTYPTSAGYQAGLYPPNTTPQGVGTAQYGIPQAPGSAAVTYGGIGNAQYGYPQGQQTATSVAQGQQGARPAFTPGIGAPAQAEIERSTTSTYDGSGNVQQTVTQEEQISSSVPATAQMGNAANPASVVLEAHSMEFHKASKFQCLVLLSWNAKPHRIPTIRILSSSSGFHQLIDFIAAFWWKYDWISLSNSP